MNTKKSRKESTQDIISRQNGQLEESERVNVALMSLLVASYRLHSSLDYFEVVQFIKEIMTNLVGAAAFGIFLIDKRKDTVSMITSEGFNNASQAECADVAAKIIASGELWISGKKILSNSGPIAGIPLRIADSVLGAIVLYDFLVQKDGFQNQDFEIFEMLGKHAATALYAAKLYNIFETEKKMKIRDHIIDLIPPSKGTPRDYLNIFENLRKNFNGNS